MPKLPAILAIALLLSGCDETFERPANDVVKYTHHDMRGNAMVLRENDRHVHQKELQLIEVDGWRLVEYVPRLTNDIYIFERIKPVTSP